MPATNARYYVVSGSGHVLLFQPGSVDQGVTLTAWVAQQVGDSAAWTSQGSP